MLAIVGMQGFKQGYRERKEITKISLDVSSWLFESSGVPEWDFKWEVLESGHEGFFEGGIARLHVCLSNYHHFLMFATENAYSS